MRIRFPTLSIITSILTSGGEVFWRSTTSTFPRSDACTSSYATMKCGNIAAMSERPRFFGAQVRRCLTRTGIIGRRRDTIVATLPTPKPWQGSSVPVGAKRNSARINRSSGHLARRRRQPISPTPRANLRKPDPSLNHSAHRRAGASLARFGRRSRSLLLAFAGRPGVLSLDLGIAGQRVDRYSTPDALARRSCPAIALPAPKIRVGATSRPRRSTAR